MIESQRLASAAVARTLEGRNLDRSLQELAKGHPALTRQQRAAAQDMSYGTVRFYGQLSALLDLLLKKPLQDEAVRALLLVALFQLQYSRAAEHAVVDHAVRAASAMGKPWAKGLVNAVLRNFLRQRPALLEQAALEEEGRYSYPKWWIEKLRAQYPETWASMLEVGNGHPPMTLRVNGRRGAALAFLALLLERGMGGRRIGEHAILLDAPVPVEKLPGFAEGGVSVQDAGAQHAAHWLDVKRGMRVLDACAAPGGKAAHLLELFDVELVALDSDASRLKKAEQGFRRLQLECQCVAGDASRPDEWWDGIPFQRILADVPCSASGVVRHHPDIKWLRRETDIAAFALKQAEILDALWRVLDRGGKLLYATCSIFAEENQQQITRFLSRQQDARQLLLPDTQDGQLIPDSLQDGFYYALLHKA